MGKGQPADATEVWWGGIRWTEGAWMQTHRFEEAFKEYQLGVLDAEMRAECSDPEDPWRRQYDERYEPYDPARPIRVPTVGLWMETGTELDFLMVAIRNVLRAQDRLPEDLRTSMAGQDVLELLRNVAEHWDEVDGRSSDKLANDHPDVDLGTIAFTGKEIWVADVPLSRMRAWLARVRVALVEALTREGITVPGTHESTVEGDDDLAWPEDRRRYQMWSAPRMEMEDWPTGDMPEELREAVQQFETQRFQRLRQRDHAD